MNAFAVTVCVLVFCCLCNAKTFPIGSQTEFETFASMFRAGTFSNNYDTAALTKSIDVGTLSYPVGCSEADCKNAKTFSGTFDGRNNTITVSMTNEGGNAGLFCEMRNAVVKDLIISGSFSGENVGGLMIIAYDNVKIENVINKAKITGKTTASGFIGYISINNPTSVTYENCTNDGAIDVFLENNHHIEIGAFLGWITAGSQLTITMDSCTNRGNIIVNKGSYTGVIYAGGMAGHLTSKNKVTLIARDCLNNGNINIISSLDYSRTVYVSGMLAFFQCRAECEIEMTNNANNGNIYFSNHAVNSNRGRLIGQYSKTHQSEVVIGRSSDENHKRTIRDDATINVYIGNLIGYLESQNQNNIAVTINNNINNGNINSTYSVAGSSNEWIGGLIGRVNYTTNNNDNNVMFINNMNKGDATVDVTVDGTNYVYVGGCIGRFDGGSNSMLEMNHSKNEGNVHVSSKSSASSVGSGLVGFVYSSKVHMINCENGGDVESSSDACGLVCSSESTMITNITNSVNKGSLKGKNVYGIAKVFETANNVVSLGNIKCSSSLCYPISQQVKDPNSYYVLQDNCDQCNDDLKAIIFNRKADGYYYLSSGTRMDISLNDNIFIGQQQDYLFWTPELSLYDEGTCLITIIGNVINTTKPVECGTTIGDVISTFTDDEHRYVVFDGLYYRGVLGTDTKVTSYSKIVVNDVTGRPYIEFAIPDGDEEITRVDIINALTEMTGRDFNNYISIEKNKERKELEIILYVDTIDEAEAISESLRKCSVDL